MANKYETGIKDQYGNREFDYEKAFNDLKAVVNGTKPMSNDLYEVMNLRFTIAHYNKFGWLNYYNGNWAELAREIRPMSYGGFDRPNSAPFDMIKQFLEANDKTTINI